MNIYKQLFFWFSLILNVSNILCAASALSLTTEGGFNVFLKSFQECFEKRDVIGAEQNVSKLLESPEAKERNLRGVFFATLGTMYNSGNVSEKNPVLAYLNFEKALLEGVKFDVLRIQATHAREELLLDPLVIAHLNKEGDGLSNTSLLDRRDSVKRSSREDTSKEDTSKSSKQDIYWCDVCQKSYIQAYVPRHLRSQSHARKVRVSSEKKARTNSIKEAQNVDESNEVSSLDVARALLSLSETI